MDFLATMAAGSRARVPGAVGAGRPAPALRLSDRFDVIAEIKLRAPSVGRLALPAGDRAAFIAARAASYAAAGAAAISVLTEPSRFDGALADLEAAASAAGSVPVMRKDFLVDPVQVAEAAAAGAGGVLLIARMLDDATLDACLQAAADAARFVLLEAFDRVDLERSAARVGSWAGLPLLVGVNTRDLSTLAVDPDRLASLAAHLPAGVPAVAESGLVGPEDAARVRRLGYPVALVGSALMSAEDPEGLLSAMIAAGRG